jgi:hypothetical protein
MSPADFPWWSWILGGMIGVVLGFWINIKVDKVPAETFGLILAASGCISILIGIIRFVKWVWAG